MKLRYLTESALLTRGSDAGIGGSGSDDDGDDGWDDDDGYSWDDMENLRGKLEEWMRTSRYSASVSAAIVSSIEDGIVDEDDVQIDSDAYQAASEFYAVFTEFPEADMNEVYDIECNVPVTWMVDKEEVIEKVKQILLKSDFYAALDKEPRDIWQIVDDEVVIPYLIYLYSMFPISRKDGRHIEFAAYTWATANGLSDRFHDSTYYDIKEYLVTQYSLNNIEPEIGEFSDLSYERPRWQVYNGQLMFMCMISASTKIRLAVAR